MAEIERKTIKCTQEGCTVSDDGKCLEGLDPESCTHCTIVEGDSIADTTITNDDEGIANPEEEAFHNVHQGEALKLDETTYITNSSLTRLILLAGLSEAGKTTMLASLFDLFQSSSKYARYIFSGSKTLIGFERRCHHARINSKRIAPTTERTKRSDSRVFLHLQVKDGDNSPTDLLFTDISGEIFKELSNSAQECEKFELAKRADHFALFIDSFQLSDPTLRNVAKTRSISILRRLIEAKMLDENTFIDIIFSKWDLLEGKPDKANHQIFVDELKEEIKSRFSNTHKEIAFFELASRPKDPDILEFGYGIENIFTDWVQKSRFVFDNRSERIIKNPNRSTREFSKYEFG